MEGNDLTKQLGELESLQQEYENAKLNLNHSKFQLQEANKQNIKIKQEILRNYQGIAASQKGKEIELIIEKIDEMIKEQIKIETEIDAKLVEVKIKIEEVKDKLLVT